MHLIELISCLYVRWPAMAWAEKCVCWPKLLGTQDNNACTCLEEKITAIQSAASDASVMTSWKHSWGMMMEASTGCFTAFSPWWSHRSLALIVVSSSF